MAQSFIVKSKFFYSLVGMLILISASLGYMGFDMKNRLESQLGLVQGELAESKGLLQGLSNEISLVKDDFNNNLDNVKKDLDTVKKNVSTQSKQIGEVEKELDIQLTQIAEQDQEIENQKKQLEEISQKEAVELANIENAKKSIVVITYTIQESDNNAIQTISSICSGVIYKQNGQTLQVATNQHCVDWNYLGWSHYDSGEAGSPEIVSETLEVSTINGVKHAVSSVQKAQDMIDLAIITFQANNGETFSKPQITTSLPTVGDDAVAIGSPSGLSYTTTKGIVSATRQGTYMQGGKVVDLVQTDAAINPGNSGGGLFRLSDGALLGINSFTFQDTEGLNFAISTKSLVENFP